jgi:outer membrane protein TolC
MHARPILAARAALLGLVAAAGFALAVSPGACATPAPGPAAPEVPALAAGGLAADSTLSLPALERWVMMRNPDLEAMRQALAGAHERARTAGSLMDPEVEFALGPSSLGDAELPTAYRIGIRQTIPWSKLGPERSAARWEVAAEGAGLAAASIDFLREVRAAYVDYVRGSAELRVVRELKELLEQFRHAALARYASGTVGESDPLMAEVEQSRLEHEGIDGMLLRDTAAARLNAMLHRPWDAPLPPAPAGFAAPRPVPPLALLVELALGGRPEVAASEARGLASRARLTLAGRQWLPDVGVMAAYDRFMMEEPYRPMVGVSLTVPLYFGRIAAARREARAGVAQAAALTAAQRDRVIYEVQTAYLRVRNTAHEVGLTRDTELPVSQRALGAARAGYEAGRGDFLTLLSAERELARTRLMEIRVMAEYELGLADLERAVGQALPEAGAEIERHQEGTR